MRTMLIIGTTFADAVAFIGSDIGPTQDDALAYIAASGPERDARWPRRDDRASAQIPDRLWPDGSYLTAWFRGSDVSNENGSAPYDAVIVTAAAWDAGVADAVAALAREWIWVEGMGEMRLVPSLPSPTDGMPRS